MGNLKMLFTLVFALLFSLHSNAATKRLWQDSKYPTQAAIEHQTITTPILADDDYVLAANASSATLTTTVTTMTHQPDVCRALAVLPGGTTADVAAMSVTVAGTNFFGAPISETFAFAANASTATNGAKAFCTVTSVSIPPQDGGSATFAVGVIDKLGLKRCMANAGAGAWAVFDGAFEATRGTWVADADEVEKNTYDPNGSLNGSKSVEAYFVQNFGCAP